MKYLMASLAMTPLIAISQLLNAELSAFEQALQNDNPIETKESVEVRGGIKYRKIESNQGVFYFKLLTRAEDVSELDCKTDFNAQAPELITMAAQVFKRSRIFIKTLKETCENHNGQTRFKTDWRNSTKIGVQLPDGKNDLVKEKEVHINPLIPLPNAGFSGSF